MDAGRPRWIWMGAASERHVGALARAARRARVVRIATGDAGHAAQPRGALPQPLLPEGAARDVPRPISAYLDAVLVLGLGGAALRRPREAEVAQVAQQTGIALQPQLALGGAPALPEPHAGAEGAEKYCGHDRLSGAPAHGH